MSEILLRDQIELERQRDAFSRLLDRTHGVEKDVVVLKTRFDASMEHAVTQDDLKQQKRDIDEHIRYTLSSIHETIHSANAHQAKDILAQVELMNARATEHSSRDSQNLRRSVMLAALGTVFSVVGSVLFLIMTGQR